MTKQTNPSSILPARLRDITLKSSQRTLLDKISLDIPAQCKIIILGPNGAGKSLLLRVLHGLIQPTSGHMSWNDGPMSHQIRQHQAMVFQRPVLLRRTVAENVAFVLALKQKNTPDHCDALLDHVGLLHLARYPARQLSGGEQQRLAFARALATSSEILFLDEPTSNLDPASVVMFEDLVQKSHANGLSIVQITHDIGQAKRLADTIVFMHNGQIVEQTPAEQFFRNPQSEAAQRYLAGDIIL